VPTQPNPVPLYADLTRSEFDRNGSVNIRHFWLRRALRILPPFYRVALAATLLALILYPPGTVYAPAMIAEVLFYANYWGIYGINREAPGTGVVWSLAVEQQFYLLSPLLYISIQKMRVPRSGQAWLLWGLCALILAWRCVLVMALHSDSARIYIATDTRVDSVLFGCALAVWSNPVLDEPTGSPGLWKFLLLPAARAAVTCLATCCDFSGRINHCGVGDLRVGRKALCPPTQTAHTLTRAKGFR
jgi:peptidoglycan/LPS O-acetylase OafA/YrhL